jgi:5-carboxymethyl-2-hydroxymuconate isomerase
MPLVSLEYTDNIKLSGAQLKDFFSGVHAVITQCTDANIHSCKSSARALTQYYVGDGTDQAGFVLMRVKVLSGRSCDVRMKLKDSLLDFLTGWVRDYVETLPALRVLVEEIDKDFYAMS